MSSYHLTLDQARARARELVTQLGGGSVVIHGKSGGVRRETVERSDKYFG